MFLGNRVGVTVQKLAVLREYTQRGLVTARQARPLRLKIPVGF